MKKVASIDRGDESRWRKTGWLKDMFDINEFYIDIIRMIALLFAPLLTGTVLLVMVLIYFAIVGPPG
jgi:hypothetical protein